MDLSRLSTVLKDGPKYRYKQVQKAVYQDLIEDWQEATSLPAELRNTLAEDCPLEIRAEIFISPKGASKTLFTLSDGLKIEAVLIEHKDGRRTVCVSSQVGCPLGCLFCATGRIGFKRNLSREEIVEQVLFFARYLKRRDAQISNVVFMGMGEPFLNYDNVIGAIRFLNSSETMNLGARRFSISTAGITHGIHKLAKENLEVNLALSLHSADNALRSRIMPINKKYPLDKVLAAVRDYISLTRRRVMFEYVMIKDLNDSIEDARRLAALLKGYLGFINLIAYNETDMFKPSPADRIKKFKEILEGSRLTVIERHRFGENIDAACGQLAAKGKLKNAGQSRR